MDRRRDPIQEAANGSRDLYDVASWEPRSLLDRLSVRIYRLTILSLRVFMIILALVILAVQLILGGLGAIIDPIVGLLVLVSIVPALGIAAYIWYLDITTREPLSTLLITLILGVLFATFAAVINTLTFPVFVILPILGLPLFYLLIVGPIEEIVKILAVRLHAYRHENFNAVVDGAVYGAAAGLGFATIENAIYISASMGMGFGEFDAIAVVGGTVAARTLAGPGHVLYSAVAGFYLGLARFNPDHTGPIVAKGLLLAIAFHAIYNTTVFGIFSLPLGPQSYNTILYLLFITLYFGGIGYFLYRKINRYRMLYNDTITRPSFEGQRNFDQ